VRRSRKSRADMRGLKFQKGNPLSAEEHPLSQVVADSARPEGERGQSPVSISCPKQCGATKQIPRDGIVVTRAHPISPPSRWFRRGEKFARRDDGRSGLEDRTARIKIDSRGSNRVAAIKRDARVPPRAPARLSRLNFSLNYDIARSLVIFAKEKTAGGISQDERAQCFTQSAREEIAQEITRSRTAGFRKRISSTWTTGCCGAFYLITEIEQHGETGSLAYMPGMILERRNGASDGRMPNGERGRERETERKGEECDGSRTYISPLI